MSNPTYITKKTRSFYGTTSDIKTKSEWNYDGFAISGPLEGYQLTRMSIEPGFWFEWVAFHPQTEVWGV